MAKHTSKGEPGLRKRAESKPTRSKKWKRIACLHHRSHMLSSAESQECEIPSLVSLQSSVSCPSAVSLCEEVAASSDCSSRSNSSPACACRDRKIIARSQRGESKQIVMDSNSMETRSIAAVRSCKNCTHKEVQAMPPAANDRLVREGTPNSYEKHIEDQRSCNIKSFARCDESRPPSAAFAGRRIIAEADVEDFFREAEQQQRMHFVERYNFDPVNERPLPGRYEWVSMQDHHHP